MAKKHFYRIRYIIEAEEDDRRKIMTAKEMEFRNSDGDLRKEQMD